MTGTEILRILLAENGITPSPGLEAQQLVRLALDTPGLAKELEDAVDAVLERTGAALIPDQSGTPEQPEVA